ncbi:MAG: sugar kinase [Chitinophagaceae bacterium]|nr:sugar kinase [Chitinophagaceae bacterium]
MANKDAYIIIDFGTGNLRSAVVSVSGELLGTAREDIVYHRDEHYADSIYFKPRETWQRIIALCKAALSQAGDITIQAITATSQREGIVVISDKGASVIGMPNIDHRGRQWENMIKDKDDMYQKTGRYPTSLFSALKIVGFQKVYTDIKVNAILSISDWIEYMFCGIPHYEHSQASETLLYDVAGKQWSTALIKAFGLDNHILPPLTEAGTVLGTVKKDIAGGLSISPAVKVVVGGADTQLAALSTNAAKDDVVIVSGTTTPIIKLVDHYIMDAAQRTWTGRHVTDGYFMLEANAGVTGLNYQRLKKIFYPNEGYDVIEEELANEKDLQCMAALGSLLADEKDPLIRGGFIFNVPVNHELSRAHFVWATLWDIACSIYENYKSLCSVTPDTKDAIWVCGGGMESRKLRQFIATLTRKNILIKDNFRHASVTGGAILCNQATDHTAVINNNIETVAPSDNTGDYISLYQQWKQNRSSLKKISDE